MRTFATSRLAGCCERWQPATRMPWESWMSQTAVTVASHGPMRRYWHRPSAWPAPSPPGSSQVKGSSSGHPIFPSGFSWNMPAVWRGWFWSRQTRPFRPPSLDMCWSNQVPSDCSWWTGSEAIRWRQLRARRRKATRVCARSSIWTTGTHSTPMGSGPPCYRTSSRTMPRRSSTPREQPDFPRVRCSATRTL